MSDPLHLLQAPLGEPGSGRVRYGAAMALHARGLLSEAALEVYRICSPLDAQDPAPLLRERGLRPLTMRDPVPATHLATLLLEADHYLATLAGPGPAEVRLGLARATAASAPLPPRTDAVVEAHLGPALGLLTSTHPALANAIAAAAPPLNGTWLSLMPADCESHSAAR